MGGGVPNWVHRTLAERSLGDKEPAFPVAGAIRHDIDEGTLESLIHKVIATGIVPCGFIAVCRQDFNYHILRGVIISTTSKNTEAH